MKKLLLVLFILTISGYVLAQRSITLDDLSNWKRITTQKISDDGKWVACKMEPWVGDASVQLFNQQGKVSEYPYALNMEFSSSSHYFIVTQTCPKTQLDSLKLKKTKGKDMPMNKLIIRHSSGKEEIIDSLKNYKLAAEGDWIAYQKGRKDSTLYVRLLNGDKEIQYPAVKQYRFSDKNNVLYYVTSGDTLHTKAGLYTLTPSTSVSANLIKEGSGVFKQIAFDNEGTKLAFLYCESKDSTHVAHAVWLSEDNKPATPVVARQNKAILPNWVISENGKISFSENGERLLFGTAPRPKQKDTTQLEEYRPLVQVWNWNEHTPYTVQHHDKKEDLKKTYLALYNLLEKTTLQLATPEYPNITLGSEGNSEIALLSTSLPYPVVSMWEGSERKDYYTVSLKTGEKKLLIKETQEYLRISPQGKYAWWYARNDSSWYSINLNNGKKVRITTPETFVAWDEETDTPGIPSAYGTAGWTEDDKYVLLYDRYDIWQIDPTGASPGINLTKNGRQTTTAYRLVSLDKDEKFIDSRKAYILRGFNATTKGTGYYSWKFTTPKALLAGNFMLKGLAKAKQADKLIFTRETFNQYPDIHFTDMNFKKPVKLTDGAKQSEGLLDGTAELVSWLSLDGVPVEGLLYKPSNFDPSRKYPMIVNFYERSTENLYSYRMPEPHRSTVDYHFYLSNGYVVFNPEVYYKTGYPGESCFNCVMPGIAKIVSEGYVDEKAIGAQGHSWGGYQVAYLATRTNLFAAIESGAPVVNMFSAYGGIRWGTGRSRMYQYEIGQSRVGDTPWNAPLRYFENSPLFTMDKVETPILIMHNDQDGHVPWYQGIEYFNALKRLGKPAWLLNYTGEIHWPMKMANRIDFQQRMFQFFNHYLKGEPMPKWMKEGVPAVDQEFELGY